MNKRFKRLTALVVGGLVMASLSSTALAADIVSLKLDESVELALENNRTIKSAVTDVDAAEWAYREARRSAGPTLTLSHTSTRTGGERGDIQFRTYGSRSSHQHAATVSMPLYTGGRLENTMEAARYGRSAADLSLETTKQAIRYRTTQQYYQVLQYRNLIGVYRMSVDNLQQHLDNSNAQYRVGTVAKSDVLSSQVSLANAEQNLVNAQNNYDVSAAQLNNLIGLPTGTVLNLADELSYTKYAMTLPDLTDYALVHRPDAIAADYQVKSAEAQMKAARSGNLPTVSASVGRTSGSYGGSAASGDFDGMHGWTGEISVGWTPFDNNVTLAKINQQKAALHKAQQTAESTREQIRLDVQTAYLNLVAAEKNIATTRTAVEQAKEDYKIAQARYAAGVGTNLDVTDADERLVTAQTNYYTALYNYNVSKAALDQSIGTPVDLDAASFRQNIDMERLREARRQAEKAMYHNESAQTKAVEEQKALDRKLDEKPVERVLAAEPPIRVMGASAPADGSSKGNRTAQEAAANAAK
ncbi:hypothetical protein TAMA11512_06740 [Selenomonas sp. TAMA-11512]|uniref:TolC family protein n=1 Tax=Selenomonas sp. TAMA-11512 TaxID=3095337 RepID=UPI00308B08E6|nr:hypothetical protein TAMA11512_06740 [Selenomonas sp. TAMA-11512]